MERSLPLFAALEQTIPEPTLLPPRVDPPQDNRPPRKLTRDTQRAARQRNGGRGTGRAGPGFPLPPRSSWRNGRGNRHRAVDPVELGRRPPLRAARPRPGSRFWPATRNLIREPCGGVGRGGACIAGSGAVAGSEGRSPFAKKSGSGRTGQSDWKSAVIRLDKNPETTKLRKMVGFSNPHREDFPMSIEFQTIELADGRQMRRTTSRPDRLALHGSTAVRPRPEPIDPQVLREMRRLEAENSALKAEERRSQLGLQYKRRVDSLVLAGTKRARAVQMASRENPVGRAAYLRNDEPC